MFYNTVRKPPTNAALNHSGKQQKTLNENNVFNWSFSRAGKLRANMYFLTFRNARLFECFYGCVSIYYGVAIVWKRA